MGKLIIFSAPSGSGKTTIVKEVLKQFPDLEFSISACSRQPRGKEIDGVDYYFLSVDEFKKQIELNEFLEWEEVYPNQFYGTLKSELLRIWSKTHHVIFDVDVVGGMDIKKQFSGNALSIFIKAPSIESLRERLIKRATDSAEQIEKRINKAEYELGFADKFDVQIVNDNLETAIQQTIQYIKAFLESN